MTRRAPPERREEQLRALAVSHTLFTEKTLARAVARLGFVQADPIKAPATAQDLVLRHRVRGYAVGDLERHYARLPIEEDYLYAYGVLARATSHALHPRPKKPMTAVEKRVLAIVRERGTIHPSDIADGARITNAWGGQSRATTWALERLHRRGLLRVVRRDRGVRVYDLAPEREVLAPDARLRMLVLAVANVLSPVLERTLRANVARFRFLGDPRKAIDTLVHHGSLARIGEYLATSTRCLELGDDVRFLAPFDPIVWDRRRFEHLFGWAYRFEAYTPREKRVRGYYALPILFRDRIVGWANVTDDDVSMGFVVRPREKAFERELEAEMVRIRTFVEPAARGKLVGRT
ncbi:MAG TPA: crosslink repair DNA glycosylase YcaQ family protein [Polyangiaceae bacterium]|nr:crosslink repair DNA glycosylase YcaQ family protein [Polyangiaceae bacterium]